MTHEKQLEVLEVAYDVTRKELAAVRSQLGGYDNIQRVTFNPHAGTITPFNPGGPACLILARDLEAMMIVVDHDLQKGKASK